MDIAAKLAAEFSLRPDHVANIMALIDEGNTIPFIARYRKEMTGHCDDQVLREFSDRLTYLNNLEKRKEEVARAITEQEKMTDEIAEALSKAETLTEVEDIYRPYKQKKKTRASVAIAKGLQPLADLILAQEISDEDLTAEAEKYISEEKGVASAKEAIAGALDIIAEIISDHAELRKKLRFFLTRNGLISSKFAAKIKDESKKPTYEMYAEYDEAVSEVPSHRILALNRGEQEGVLSVKLSLNRMLATGVIGNVFLKSGGTQREKLTATIEDAYDRLIFPSIEREVRSELTDRANEQAIKMFEVNLRQLLLQPPVKDMVTLGLDPAYRTGCKIAVVDATGKVLDTTVVYPTPPQNKTEEAKAKLLALIKKHNVDVISIGNGTASKESEIFVAELIKECPRKVSYMVVNEAGASVYSASKLGAEEFPDFDVSLRSAVSIARRLQDPLAELIKIDPKSIGVGQYQHDMPKNRLDEALKGVLEDCVNSVGVDLNTASVSLLSFVSGLNAGIARNIVEYREANGKFTDRNQLLKVAKLGPKAFTQCAGFLRIPRGDCIFDNTAVHPESYAAAEALLKAYGYTDADVAEHNISELPQKIATSGGAGKVAESVGVGELTLQDIVTELLKPGRDIRDALPAPMLRSDIMDINDLKPGMELTGTVRNVIDFGVFVDIGVHQDGLVHVSEISDRFIKHPSEVLKVGEVVKVRVLGVDLKKNRISLSMKTAQKAKKNG
ncbi:MAG: RNA-binding transcriptional accessory protein [Clostridia bacterium]|nr:RNA-binding transcriptional accessory protein [Clostridia bacterium]